MTKRQIDKKYPDKNTIAAYAICKGNKPTNTCIDAYKTTHGAPRLANDGKHSNLGTNSKLGDRFKLVWTRRLPENTEFLTDYGKGYWSRVLQTTLHDL